MRIGAPLALLLALGASLAGGCGRDSDAVPLTAWTLEPPDGPPRAQTLPAHIEGLPSRNSTYVLRTDAIVPPALRGQPLTLAIPFLPAIVHLEAAGEEILDLETSLTDRYRTAGVHRYRIPGNLTAGATLPLRLTVEHTWLQSSWIEAAPTLTTHPEGTRRFRLLRFFHVFTAAAALIGGVFVAAAYLVIFLVNRRRIAHGWFALSSFAPAFYPLFVLGLSQPIFGTLDVPITMFMLVVGNVAGVHFAHAQYDLGPPSRLWAWSLVIPLTTALIERSPFQLTPLLVGAAILPIVFTIFYLIATYARLARRGAPGAVVILACWVILLLTTWTDILAWTGGGEIVGGVRLGCVGVGLFSLATFLYLGKTHIASLDRADQLNAELAARVQLLETRHREIQVLNDELRRQVGERSGHLADALARIGAAPRKAALLVAGELADGPGGRYKVIRPIGQGGMGAVYEVERLTDGRRLAMKILTLSTSGPALARFAREAEIAAQITHPNVVAIVDMDVSRSGSLFLVMELVDGTSLADSKARHGQPGWALPLLAHMARGLAAIHERGVVHRDLKPANVLITTDGTAKIADFGVSSLGEGATTEPHAAAVADVASSDTLQARDQLISGLTQTGVIMGTPMYMAPELARGAKDAKPSSDLYSFGLIAWELLTGAPPFPEADVLERLRGRPGRPPPGLAVAGVPARVATLIDRCLALDPTARPTAAELGAAF